MSTTIAALQTEKDPRYPIGKFRRNEADLTNHEAAIATLAALPEKMRSAVEGLGPSQLDTPYRDGGWTVRQLIHHIADSHANSYVRFKLALTEDWPTIKPYDEAAWANLADSRSLPIDVSMQMISGLHTRWVALLESMSEEDFRKGYN